MSALTVFDPQTLTDKQRAVLLWIAAQQRAGRPPSLAEIASEFDTTPSAVQHMLDRLQLKGFVTREPNVARSVRVVAEKLAQVAT